jgi:signal transduction histidine kinase/CheY-like chemotaxis protein
MVEWATRFEFEKIRSENESKEKLSKLEIKRQKAYRNSAWVVVLLLLILGWVIWRGYKNKKRVIRQLEEQKKQIEEKNHEIQAQVEEIISQKDEIERISSELHQADETKFRFFTNLSHEFRTPLTLIINPARNLLDTMPLNGDYKKQVEYIYNNAQKLFDLTNQIMDLQKLDAGKLQLNLDKDEIIEYCIGIVSSFESLCEAKNVTIQLEANCSNAYANFDKDKIGKILINLLSNAIKFCFGNTVIEIKISAINNQFGLQITDRGIGIPANEVNEVFKRYMQASTNNTSGGTGIGLAYVKELVSFMNGHVTLESIEHKGTSVSVEIPVEELEIKNSDKLQLNIAYLNKKETIKPFDITEYTEDNQDKAIIQIVEDNDELRDFIAKLFQNDYRVILANNGQDGIDKAIKYIPDMIISDVMMPLKNGFELCSVLKNDERTSHIPIVLLTAKDGIQCSVEGYHTGADDYIIKPFDNEILTLKIRNIINTRTAIGKQYNIEKKILPNAGAYADIDRYFMKKCIHIIEQNIGKVDFTVDILASELGFSRSNLYRKIVSLTTFNPAELIRNIRMQHAAHLLKTSDIRIHEVAMEVGYDSAVKFSQAFKKQHGLLPSEI